VKYFPSGEMQDPGREPVRSASASPPLEYPGIIKSVKTPLDSEDSGFSDLVAKKSSAAVI
jgi:hypothetical protein